MTNLADRSFHMAFIFISGERTGGSLGRARIGQAGAQRGRRGPAPLASRGAGRPGWSPGPGPGSLERGRGRQPGPPSFETRTTPTLVFTVYRSNFSTSEPTRRLPNHPPFDTHRPASPTKAQPLSPRRPSPLPPRLPPPPLPPLPTKHAARSVACRARRAGRGVPELQGCRSGVRPAGDWGVVGVSRLVHCPRGSREA